MVQGGAIKTGVCAGRIFHEHMKRKEENKMGKVSMELPCKVGDTVYILRGGKIFPSVVSEFRIGKDMGLTIHLEESHCYYPGSDIGTILFSSEEEAAKSLRSETEKTGNILER